MPFRHDVLGTGDRVRAEGVENPTKRLFGRALQRVVVDLLNFYGIAVNGENRRRDRLVVRAFIVVELRIVVPKKDVIDRIGSCSKVATFMEYYCSTKF